MSVRMPSGARVARLAAVAVIGSLLAAMALANLGLLPNVSAALARGFGGGYGATSCPTSSGAPVKTIDGHPLTVCAYSFGYTYGRYQTSPDVAMSAARMQFSFPGHQTASFPSPLSQSAPMTVNG